MTATPSGSSGALGPSGTVRPQQPQRPGPPQRSVVFCDFDGTITEKDMIVAVCDKFCPPEWKTIATEIMERRKTVKVGVAELFNLIPSSKREPIIAFANEFVRYRKGFPEFLDYCKNRGIEFVVCSGGIDFFLKPLMEPFRNKIDRIVCIPSDFSGPTIQLSHPYACDSCGTCKVKVMQEYPDARQILIGDGITDVHGATQAGLVYARNGLKGYLDQDGIAYQPFENFHDIIDRFEKTKSHASAH